MVVPDNLQRRFHWALSFGFDYDKVNVFVFWRMWEVCQLGLCYRQFKLELAFTFIFE